MIARHPHEFNFFSFEHFHNACILVEKKMKNEQKKSEEKN